MTNSFDYFDIIFCVNLDSRPERWAESLEEFEKVGIADKVRRLSGHEYKIDHWMRGRMGCFSSFRECVKIANSEGAENVLVFEDDVKFVNDTNEVLSKSIEDLKKWEWDMFHLGTNPQGEGSLEYDKSTPRSNNLLRLKSGLCLHAAAYNKKFFKEVLATIPEGARILEWLISEHNRTGHGSMDGWVMTHVCPNREVYCTNPMIATQRPSFSNIDNKMADFGDDLLKAFDGLVEGLDEEKYSVVDDAGVDIRTGKFTG